jgi:2'-5' RNA ligase
MATRRRLGVALVLPEPIATEVNGLRRGLGDPALGRIPPHLTLVPPVNVRQEDLGRALARLRLAAAGAPLLLHLGLGPPASFLPANPVLILTVSGDLLELRALRQAVFVEPLARSLTWPFVPHVTVADGVEPERIDAAMTALHHYRDSVAIDRVQLLEERRELSGGGPGVRRWVPIADAVFGPPAVVGRGGLNLELTRSGLIDPEAAALLDGAGRPEEAPLTIGAVLGPGGQTVVVTARQGGNAAGLSGSPVGVGAAWWADGQPHIGVFVAPAERGLGYGSHLLAAVEAAVVDSGWPAERLQAHGPARFYELRSPRSRVKP